MIVVSWPCYWTVVAHDLPPDYSPTTSWHDRSKTRGNKRSFVKICTRMGRGKTRWIVNQSSRSRIVPTNFTNTCKFSFRYSFDCSILFSFFFFIYLKQKRKGNISRFWNVSRCYLLEYYRNAKLEENTNNCLARKTSVPLVIIGSRNDLFSCRVYAQDTGDFDFCFRTRFIENAI